MLVKQKGLSVLRNVFVLVWVVTCHFVARLLLVDSAPREVCVHVVAERLGLEDEGVDEVAGVAASRLLLLVLFLLAQDLGLGLFTRDPLVVAQLALFVPPCRLYVVFGQRVLEVYFLVRVLKQVGHVRLRHHHIDLLIVVSVLSWVFSYIGLP